MIRTVMWLALLGGTSAATLLGAGADGQAKLQDAASRWSIPDARGLAGEVARALGEPPLAATVEHAVGGRLAALDAAAPPGAGVSGEGRRGLGALAELRERLDLLALGVVPSVCWSLRCPSAEGASEAAMKTCACRGCRVARYCSESCQRASWKAHKSSCNERAAERAAAVGAAADA